MAHPGTRRLVTGASGFVGRYLVDALLARRGEDVVALTRGTPVEESRAEWRRCDLAEGDLRSLLHEVRPTHIYHLAGFSDAGASVRQPEAAWRDNVVVTERLLEGIRDLRPAPRLLHVSTGMVYGRGDDEVNPLDETCPFRPETPYAQSKAAAEVAVERFGSETGIEIVRARPFNHTGPGQSVRFAVPGFAKRLTLIAEGKEPPVLETGNLDVERDLSDVRDVVAVYLMLMERGVPGEAYNVASGISVTMRYVVERMIALAGVEVEIRSRADLVRAGEPTRLRVAVGKLRGLGWVPQFTLDRTLVDTLAECRQRGPDEGKLE